eukprot:4576760-Amphidinium_carterae.1
MEGIAPSCWKLRFCCACGGRPLSSCILLGVRMRGPTRLTTTQAKAHEQLGTERGGLATIRNRGFLLSNIPASTGAHCSPRRLVRMSDRRR